MRIVYARDTLATGTADGLTVSLVAGDPWDAADPLVRQRPELFGPEPPPQSIRRTAAPVIEQATAAPGERRNVRRD